MGESWERGINFFAKEGRGWADSVAMFSTRDRRLLDRPYFLKQITQKHLVLRRARTYIESTGAGLRQTSVRSDVVWLKTFGGGADSVSEVSGLYCQ